MGFKSFFKLCEEKKSGFNVGDVMEGIVAIGVALHICYGEIDKEKINRIRQQVNIDTTSSFQSLIDTDIAENNFIKSQLSFEPNTRISVGINLKLKPNSVKGAFGREMKPILQVDSRIDSLIKNIKDSHAMKKINDFIIKILKLHKPNDVIFYVIADGLDNASSGGEIKGDVTLTIEVKSKGSEPKDIHEPVKFSLKADSQLTATLGFFSGILQVSKSFKLPLVENIENEIDMFPTVDQANKIQEIIINYPSESSKDTHILFYLNQYIKSVNSLYTQYSDKNERDVAKKEMKQKNIRSIADVCLKQMERQLSIKDKNYATQFNILAFNFIQKQIFGSDMADVIDISSEDIKEIRKANFDELKEKLDVEVSTVGDNIKFIGKDKISNERNFLYEIHMTVKDKGSIFIKIGDFFYG